MSLRGGDYPTLLPTHRGLRAMLIDYVLWECIEWDEVDLVQSGRQRFVKAQITQMADYCPTPVPDDLRSIPAEYPASMYFEECRAGRPEERDRLALGEAVPSPVIGDAEAKALCRKFQPTAREIRKVLDWGLARGASGAAAEDMLRSLIVLSTQNQLRDEWPRRQDVAASPGSDFVHSPATAG